MLIVCLIALAQPSPYVADRADLAERLIRFESVWASSRDLDRKRSVIPVFSQAVLGFLGGNSSSSCRAVDESIAKLNGTEPNIEDAIGLRIFPAVVEPGGVVRWRARWNYEPNPVRPIQLTIAGETFTIKPGETKEGTIGPIARSRTEKASSGSRKWSFPIHAIEGVAELAKLADASAHPEAKGFASLYARRETNEVEPDWTRLAARARRVISDGESRPRGETPLVLFGRTWMRAALPDSGPGVLVIAVHGAGGSENLFFQGYGAGIAARLSAKRRWALVAPRASRTTVDDAMGFYRWAMGKDPKKVFLMGHSAGGALVLRALGAGSRADAVALFAPAASEWPKQALTIPAFLAVGEQEISLLAQNSDRLRKSRSDLRYLRVDPCEHYLIVGEAAVAAYRFLDEVLER